MMIAPKFWTEKGLISSALLPLSALWMLAGRLRTAFSRPESADLPVICIGNISVGGTGKTPVTAMLCRIAKEQGHQPCILMRGYKGRQTGPVFAEPSVHTSADIGDEAVMLALTNDVCVSADRIRGARFIAAQNKFDLIIMDDGMQNPWLRKDITITVFDGQSGLGNQRILPAGPLREPVSDGLNKADAVILNGKDETGLKELIPQQMQVFEGQLHPDQKIARTLKGKRLIGFAGIGRPQRFFTTLKQTGAELVRELSFADHHSYSEADLSRLYQEALHAGAELVTTHKDWVRLPPEWRARILALPVSFRLSRADKAKLVTLLSTALAKRLN